MEGKSFTNQRAVGVGVLSGFIVAMTFSIMMQIQTEIHARYPINLDLLGTFLLLCCGSPGIVFGALGALAGNRGKNARVTV